MSARESDPELTDGLLARALAGDQQSMGALFCRHEPALRKMIQIRVDPRVQTRIDAEDVLQEIYLEYARCLPKIGDYQGMPFHLWLRMLAGRKLQAIHRQHLGVAARDAEREVSLYLGPLPEASSQSWC